MTIIGAAIVPHGSMILPNDSETVNEHAFKIHKAMNTLAKDIEEKKPEIIFLSTPHGLSLNHSFGIYLNSRATGTAEWNNEYNEYKSSLVLDQEHSKNILEELAIKHNFEGITAYSKSIDAPLRWGEVVPTWFLKKINSKYIIVSQPARRQNKALAMIDELISLGKDLGEYFESITEKVFVLISGDLAHTYQADGPYGKHSSAEPFDIAIEQWVKTLDSKYLLQEAGSLLNTALCCGYTGFVLLGGILESIQKSIVSEVLINTHPTYYGMIVANFVIK